MKINRARTDAGGGLATPASSVSKCISFSPSGDIKFKPLTAWKSFIRVLSEKHVTHSLRAYFADFLGIIGSYTHAYRTDTWCVAEPSFQNWLPLAQMEMKNYFSGMIHEWRGDHCAKCEPFEALGDRNENELGVLGAALSHLVRENDTNMVRVQSSVFPIF